MGRHDGPGGRRGAHRAEPESSGALANVGHMLGSTVPKHVEPPRLLSVLLISGVALGLLLFAYSTTQIYLRFSAPPGREAAPQPEPSSIAPGRAAGPETEDTGESGTTSQSGESAAGPGTVSYRLVESSDHAFTGQITVTNTSGAPLEDWQLTLGFADARVTSAWDVDWESTDEGLTARQSSRAGPLAPGESATVNFTAEGAVQAPTACSLNGHSCGL